MFLKLRTDLPSLLCWHAGPKGSWRHNRSFKHDGSGCDDRVRSDDRTIQYDRIHADQRTGLHVGAVDRCVVADASAFIDLGFALVERAMEHGAILDVHPRPNCDGCDIPTDDTIEPAR